MNQGHPAQMSQMGFLEEKLDFSESFGHGTQTSHLVYFLSQRRFAAYYTFVSSTKSSFQKSKSRISRFFEVNICISDDQAAAFLTFGDIVQFIKSVKEAV